MSCPYEKDSRWSPFTVTFVMAGGLVALLLLTGKKKTPIDSIQGLPPYEGPPLVGAAKGKRTNEHIAQHWDRIAAQCEADAKNPRHREVRALNLELAADARKKAADTRAGRGAWDEEVSGARARTKSRAASKKPVVATANQRLSQDLGTAATITWQQSLLARGKHPPEEIVDPSFLGTHRGQVALHHLRHAGVNLEDPFAPPLWNLRRQLDAS